jgi:tetratricopeptide (TPR) repeat protein
VQQLLGVVVQERILGDHDLPDDPEAVKGLFRQTFEAGRWRHAMALAIRGEELAATGAERVSWRANRAICLQQFGLRDHAIQVLLGCISDPDAPPDRLYQFYRSLAEALASGGHVGPASAMAGRAIELAPPSLPPHWRWQLLSTRARLLLQEMELAGTVDRPLAQTALEMLEEALPLVPSDQAQARILLGIQAAVARAMAGDALGAAARLEALRTDSERLGQPLAHVGACIALGRLRRDGGDFERAERLLVAAEQVAVDEGFIDEAFEAYFELHLLAKAQKNGREGHYLRRCRRFHPLVQARAPHVTAYEKIARGIA